jgi:thioredoxin-related protein
MKRLVLLSLACLLLLPSCYAEGRNKKKSADAASAGAVVDDKEIHWMNIDEVQVAMKKQPKMVWIDVYTDWCGWCKRMDKTTFSNPNVIKYMNEHFYAVKLDAEQKTEIRFMGKMYPFVEGQRANAFATQLLQGQMSYPTSVFMEANFQNPMPIPGYQDVKNIEMILKYLAEGLYKNTSFDKYAAAFTPTWL